MPATGESPRSTPLSATQRLHACLYPCRRLRNFRRPPCSYPSLTLMSNFDQTCEQYGAYTRITPSYKRCAPSCQPGAAERRMSAGKGQHALDNFRDSVNSVVVGLCLSPWRRPHPHIARACSDLVAMEPAHRSEICVVRRPNRPNLRGRQDLTLRLLLFKACWPSM